MSLETFSIRTKFLSQQSGLFIYIYIYRFQYTNLLLCWFIFIYRTLHIYKKLFRLYFFIGFYCCFSTEFGHRFICFGMQNFVREILATDLYSGLVALNRRYIQRHKFQPLRPSLPEKNVVPQRLGLNDYRRYHKGDESELYTYGHERNNDVVARQEESGTVESATTSTGIA